MKIISIHRDTKELALPEVFTVGSVPTIDGEAIEHNPPVKSIVFYETGAGNGKAYRGKCYLVSFADSNVKRVIPASSVVEIAYEADAEAKTKMKKAETPEVEATE
jgi:hypothetical protein